MAKCTDKERQLLDAYLKNDDFGNLLDEVLDERVSKELRNRYKFAYSSFIAAQDKMQSVRSEFFEIGCGQHMLKIIQAIEQEVIDSK